MLKILLKVNVLLIVFVMALNNNIYAKEHAILDQLLKDYVIDGLVNYQDLCVDERLGQYIDQLSSTDPDRFQTRDAELAFWINVYNANTLKVVCDDYPIESMNDLNFGGLLVSVALKKTVWDRKFIRVNKQKLSLKVIEHEIIPSNFKDPRSQLALACGAISCPPLSSSAFEGEGLDEQLNEQVKKFFNTPFYNSFDIETKSSLLSPLLDWNQKYFGQNEKDVLEFASGFTSYQLEDVDLWTIKYNKYDLTLNDKNLQNTEK